MNNKKGSNMKKRRGLLKVGIYHLEIKKKQKKTNETK